MNKLQKELSENEVLATPAQEEKKEFDWLGGSFSLGNFGPPLEVIKRYPGRHRCRACRSPFWSEKARDQFCSSCRRIIASIEEKLEKLRQTAQNAEQFYQDLENELVCPDCRWISNKGRLKTKDLEKVKQSFPNWATTAHIHSMQHIFWNRLAPFSYRRFAPKISDFQLRFYCLLEVLWGKPVADLLMQRLRALSDKEGVPLPLLIRFFAQTSFTLFRSPTNPL